MSLLDPSVSSWGVKHSLKSLWYITHGKGLLVDGGQAHLVVFELMGDMVKCKPVHPDSLYAQGSV